jgi:hypothetical protein
MNNRLGDLPDWAHDGGEDDGGGGDIEMGKPIEKKKDDIEKAIFFQAVEQIKNEIDSIIQATNSIEKINEQALQATTTEKEQELSKRLKKVLDGTNKQAKAAKNLLGELKIENEKLKDSGAVTGSDLRYVEIFNDKLFGELHKILKIANRRFLFAGSGRICSIR